MRIQLRARTADDTRSVGEAFADLLRPRDAVILTGELGAGKTTLVQGIARGLGVTDRVVSPTFTLVREYHGRLEVAHVDVYRLERIQDVMDLGLEELGDGEAVLLVEWGDAVEEVLPADHLTIELTGAEDDDTRRLVFTPGGQTWVERWERLEQAMSRWTADSVIVVGIDTSTPQTSVAIGTDVEVLASVSIAGRARQEAVTPALRQLLAWSDVDLDRVGGIAVGIGPGLFTGLRVGVQTAKTLAQVLGVPIVGIASLDVLAYVVRHTSRRIAAVIDARRGEVFAAIYRAVPGGVVRETEHLVLKPDHLVAELEAVAGEVLCVGNGAILYRREIEELGSRVEFASPAVAHPDAAALVELAVPRFLREEHDRLFDVVPLYLRKSDAEIAWDQRARGAQG